MDTKNDDSGGSDSLDKSLQKKCVVDDVGQGEGTTAKETTPGSSGSHNDAMCDGQQKPCNSMKKLKTEKHVGDGGSTSGLPTKHNTQDESLPAATQSTTNTNPAEVRDKCSHNASATAATSSNSTTTAANCTSQSNNNNAFETKVKQISKNLKETTLAETAKTNTENITEDSTSTASSSTSSTASNATSPDGSDSAATSLNSLQDNPDEQAPDMDGTSLNTSMISDSNDDGDNRSKKVRFHPDVKENDGGNRVIPKKKKKLKSGAGGDDAGTSQQQAGADDEMDLDEEDEYEEEDEFDLAKTIAEAQDYLKEHPLTFVRPCDKSAGRLQNGLLEEDDLPQLNEIAEEEEICEDVVPENGIERILGKQIKGGRVEFLLRFTDQPGLFWESEDFIATQCPSLLNQYEQNRERRQERLMRHVAKRQNLRQRYTDF